MNDRFVLRVERHSADDLAIELALLEELEVQLGDTDAAAAKRISSAKHGEHPMYSLEFAEVTTLIVTLAGAATAITSLAQTLVEFVRSRRSGDSRAGSPTIVINNTSFIVSGEADDDAEVLVSYLRDHEVREIVIAPAPSNQDPQ